MLENYRIFACIEFQGFKYVSSNKNIVVSLENTFSIVLLSSA
jgi:hypothetical protein